MSVYYHAKAVTYHGEPIGYVREVMDGWVPVWLVAKKEKRREGMPVASEELARYIVENAATQICGARFNVLLPVKLKIDLDRAAEELGTTSTELARAAISEKLAAARRAP